MAYQTSLRFGSRFRKPEGMISSLGELGEDFATLAELQLKLAALDTSEMVGRAAYPTAALVASAAVLLATVPVLLIGLAFALASAFHLDQGVMLLITGGVVALIAGAVAFIAIRETLGSLTSFRRSREELARNVSWIRTVITQSTKTTATKPTN